MKDCMIFQGHKNEAGYGRIKIKGKKVYAHRLRYCQANNLSLSDISGKVIRHKCDNPSCVNPDHLCIGTQKENMADMVMRGRSLKGVNHSQVKLTREEVEYIRNHYVGWSREWGAIPLAKKFNVSKSAIHRVIKGQSWKE
ncbi:TPA: HNH endonuclease [Salmonella enterica subsp. enterica serovar Johannesburg]|nr:HNH endonuclease [Salmonella enterica]EHX3731791.1 HNH endonuclease [Salmonella enterica subsp. enterica serovar Johannesburg]EKH1314939.1 HNH endonuclease [Escherichia coli]MEB2715836.1 HNH endonuclease [Citrobacter freundii]EJI6850224.1 HNH endonuclease [Salmonella enterica]EJM4942496.1 HNH endonuclease [Salmonella enterica]